MNCFARMREPERSREIVGTSSRDVIARLGTCPICRPALAADAHQRDPA